MQNTERRIWLLRLVVPGRWGRWLTSIIIFCVLLGLFSAADALSEDTPFLQTGAGTVLFFCTILAYIVPVFHFITERSVQALKSLAPSLDVGSESLALWERGILHKTVQKTRIVAVISISLGFVHVWSMIDSGDELRALVGHPTGLLLNSSTILLWIVMSFVISALIDNARLFNRCAGLLRVDLLNTRALTPFAAVAVSSTLAIIGTLAAFPLMNLDGTVDRLALIPGFAAISVPMVALFILPIWPVHRRLAQEKRRELDRLDSEIAAASQGEKRTDDESRPDLELLVPLLAFRREIIQVSEWPFDLSMVTRLLFYLIIPPLTWVGAALIENLVEAAL
ncbi:MAG: hypothetical protein GY725_06125 [bacterium]|nr:hypothetical protein [bacterium]